MSKALVAFGFLALNAWGAPKGAMQAGDAETRVLGKNEVEQRDRLVDRAALEAQVSAAGKLRELLRRYRGAMQEPLLLGRLGESLQQEASIRFRVAHGQAHRHGGVVDLTEFKRTMKASITTLDELIAKFPHFENIEEAWYLRGRAYEEMEDRAGARKNFLHLVTTWPDALQAPPAYMSLANFAIDENKHADAIPFLLAVEKRPEDPQFPFALYKLAWSHYNLKNIPAALGYLERHIAFYDRLLKQAPDSSSSAIRDNSLVETALFYVEGVEGGVAGYSALDALPYFRKLDQGPALGRVLLRFGRLLRAHNREGDLEGWKKLVLREESTRPESLEVAMTLFEDRVNKRHFDSLPESAKDFENVVTANRAQVAKWESYPKAQELLVKTIEEIRNLVIRNKKATEVTKLAATLAELSMSLTRVVDPKDPRVPGVHYNLAETMFEIGDFEPATAHYRWVVENWSDKSFDLRNASLRALSSRYEVLRAAGLVPKELAAKAWASNDTAKVDARLEEWVAWMDVHAARFPSDESFENLCFEADRSLYAAGQTRRAVERLLAFAGKSPESRFAIPAAALALDTYILGNDWTKTFTLVQQLTKTKAWRTSDFGARLARVEADSYYKILEAKFEHKDTDEALAASRECLRKYKDSERFGDCLLMAARASTVRGEESDAEKYLTRLITEKPGTAPATHALFERARMHERGYRFAEALTDYQSYLKAGGDVKDVNPRLLPLAWLSAKWKDVESLLARPEFCQGESSVACDRYEAITLFEDPTYAGRRAGARVGIEILGRLNKVPAANRGLWALVALSGETKLGFKDRLDLLDIIADKWNDADSAAQLQLSRRLVSTIKNTLRANRRLLQSSFALKPEKKSIERRLERVRELEEKSVKLVKLPWVRLRAEVMDELASAYADLGEDLRAIPAPKELPEKERPEYAMTLQKLALPFDEKAVEIRAKAFEVARKARVDSETLTPLAQAFAKDNPSQAKQVEELLRAPASITGPSDEELLAKLGSVKESKLIEDSWKQAYLTGNWAQIAFFTAEAQSRAKNPIAQSRVAILRYFSLLRAGARAEALVARTHINAIDAEAKTSEVARAK